MKASRVHSALAALLLLMVQVAVGEVVFQERFAGDANGDGLADGLEMIGNPKITVACSLDAGAKEGAKSQKLRVTASELSEQVGVAARPFAIKAGQDYRITLSYRTEGLEDAEVFAFLGWYDEARSRHERFDLVRGGRSDGWKTVSLFFKPESSGRASLHLRLWVLKAGGRGKAWFDGVLVESIQQEPVAAQAAASPLIRTKLIKCGWDTSGLTPDFIRANVRRMERQPFDGIMFRLDERFTNAFDTRSWPEAEVQAVIDKDLSTIEWGSFTDNFITLHCANRDGMDWFNDTHWDAIAGNMRLAGRAARAGRLKGIVFDTEPYGASPWEYRQHASRPFAQVAAKVRQRGAQFIGALQQEKPDVRLFCYWLFSYWAYYQPDLLDEADSARVERLLSQDAYGLMAPFAAGLLDGLGVEAILIDGNEAAYYYKDAADYLRGYFLLKARALNLAPPETRDKYRRQTQVAQAIWHAWTDGSAADADTPGRYLTPKERAGLLEWKVWQSLRVTDEYAWYYTDLSEWWRDPIPDKRAPVSESTRQAIAAARRAAPGGAAPSVDADELMAKVRRGQEQARAAADAGLTRRSARVAPLGQTAPPTMDGRLDDEAWKRVPPLKPFLPAGNSDTKLLSAVTVVRVAYDEKNLYVAFECQEPFPDRMVAIGDRKDDDVWKGDVVEMFLSTSGSPDVYRHFMVNPANAQWDAATGPAGEDARWSGEWLSAARVGDRGWTVELAIPWELLGGSPKPGDVRRANFCRNRRVDPEISAWSQVLQGFKETRAFGRLEFDRRQE